MDTLVRTKTMDTMVMLTLTIRTDPDQPLDACWAAITRVWTASHVEQNLRRQGWSWVRVPEVTYSVFEQSWHVHFHVLLFHDLTDRRPLASQVTGLLDRWVDAASRVNVAASMSSQQADFVNRSDRYRVVSYVMKPMGLYLAQDDADDVVLDASDEWAEPVRYLAGLSPAHLGVVAALDDNEDARRLYMEVIGNPGMVSRGGVLRSRP